MLQTFFGYFNTLKTHSEYISVPKNCEKKAVDGEMVSMHYTATLEKEDGTEIPDITIFDIYEQIIFDVLEGMCVGEKRRLVVPSELVYDDGEISSGATLFFDIELLLELL